MLIYLVLAAQFQSFRDPLIVLLGSVPLAISGALLFSFLDLTTINIYSQVGLITLVGLIAKNGILIVEFANTLQERGMAKLAAIREASLTRLRPVLMTSAATVFGHFPLVLVSGPGSEARNSIGTVLVTGMAIGHGVHPVRGAGVLLADRGGAQAGGDDRGVSGADAGLRRGTGALGGLVYRAGLEGTTGHGGHRAQGDNILDRCSPCPCDLRASW